MADAGDDVSVWVVAAVLTRRACRPAAHGGHDVDDVVVAGYLYVEKRKKKNKKWVVLMRMWN